VGKSRSSSRRDIMRHHQRLAKARKSCYSLSEVYALIGHIVEVHYLANLVTLSLAFISFNMAI
jgi:hypothetical protein